MRAFDLNRWAQNFWDGRIPNHIHTRKHRLTIAESLADETIHSSTNTACKKFEDAMDEVRESFNALWNGVHCVNIAATADQHASETPFFKDADLVTVEQGLRTLHNLITEAEHWVACIRDTRAPDPSKPQEG